MIISCPTCGARYNHQETRDLCVEVLREYTDGRQITIPKTTANLILQCRRCCSVSRIDQARSLGERLKCPFLVGAFIRRAPRPDPFAYIEAVRLGLASSPTEETLLRLEAWRCRNDSYRDLRDRRKPSPSEQPAWWRENMRRLEQLLQPHCHFEAVLLAEVSRELGDFAKCLARLAGLHTCNDGAEGIIREGELVMLNDTIMTIGRLVSDANPFVQPVPWRAG